MKKQLFILFTTFLMAINANALFEVRAGYGIQTPSDNKVSTSSIQTMSGFNIDGLVYLPMVPVGLGLRYESMGFDFNQAGGGSLSSTFKRTSLLVNYRLIDLFAYLGVIGSLGFTNDMVVSSSLGEAKWDSSMTYTVGAEGGVSLGLMSVGAELGYMGATLKDASNTGNPDAKLDGVYAKAIVGIGF